MSASIVSSICTRSSSSTSSSQPSSWMTEPGLNPIRAPAFLVSAPPGVALKSGSSTLFARLTWQSSADDVPCSPPEVRAACKPFAQERPLLSGREGRSRLLVSTSPGCKDGLMADPDSAPQSPAVIFGGLPTQLPDIDP